MTTRDNSETPSSMDKQTFYDFVEDLAYHFGQDKYIQRGERTKKRLTSWWNEVKHLPAEPLPWIAGHIKKSYEYFPKNLSKTILTLWERWLKEHPKKQVKPDTCQFCVNGWLLAYRPGEQTPVAIRCAHCCIAAPKGVWCATVSEVQAKGYDVTIFKPLYGGYTNPKELNKRYIYAN